MSEFSESYHLKSADPQDAVAILRRAGLAGYVFPAAHGWVSFVADEGQFAPDLRIVRESTALLLHYVYAEDHGWSFAFHEHGRPVTSYSCQWDPELEVTDSSLSLDTLRALVARHGAGDIDAVIARLHPASFEEAIESETAKQFAAALGLTHYEWLDFEHTAREFGEVRRAFPGVIEVQP